MLTVESPARGSMTLEQNAGWQQIAPAVEVSEQALARLVRRLCAGYRVKLALRAEADPAQLIIWLKAAGAHVTLSP